MAISLQTQLECAKREVAMRRRVYPRWVEADRMTQVKSAQEISAMEAIVETLARLRAAEQPDLLKAG